MLRQFLFSEEYGRNTIWLMLSGFFLKIGAKENLYGQIVMPEDNYLFNLDKKIFNNDYLKFNNLHYIILDGPVEHLNDNRIKENVKPLDGTFTVDVLKPVSYNNVLTKAHDVGFIAHEVQEFYPYLVSGEKDGENMQSLNYIGLIGILTKEIQDLKKRVTELENKK